MKVSRDQVEANRLRILAVAGRLFREKGFDAVTVSDVMRAAGLTHGGFYGYYRSKDDLIAATLADSFAALAKGRPLDFHSFTAAYLSAAHRDDPAGGCAMAALSGESRGQSPETRAAMTEGLRGNIARMTEGIGGSDATLARRAAIGSWSAMVGAMILSRLSDDPALSEEILAETRAWLGDRADA
jgi:TetR/AcrR family transcriptional repressor of nem operon